MKINNIRWLLWAAVLVMSVLTSCGAILEGFPVTSPSYQENNVISVSGALPPAPLGKIENAILFGWDGAQREHIKECLFRGELPVLKRISEEGSLVAIDILRTTDTKAGWAQILTGYNPEVTGVFSNGRYQPIPRGLTIFERLEEHFGRDNFVTVAVVGKKGNVDDDPPSKKRYKEGDKLDGGQIITENGIKYLLTPGKPYFYTRDSMEVFLNGLNLDEVVGENAIKYLDIYHKRPFFFFVHFASVDHLGHAFGENSKQYNDALISNDYWTGKIIDKLKELGVLQRTALYVTADHGFDEGEKNHADAPYVFLASSDRRIMRRGERADIAPTIMENFGLGLTSYSPLLDGRSLARPYQLPAW